MFLKNAFSLDCACFDVLSEDDNFYYIKPTKLYPTDTLSKRDWQKSGIEEPETPVYNRAYVDRLFRDGMNDY